MLGLITYGKIKGFIVLRYNTEKEYAQINV